MDTKQYFQIVKEKIDNMTDDEFNEVMLEAGIENCPNKENVNATDISNELNEKIINQIKFLSKHRRLNMGSEKYTSYNLVKALAEEMQKIDCIIESLENLRFTKDIQDIIDKLHNDRNTFKHQINDTVNKL